tara:strand:+ start:337 stop:1347 length:1011 start_codon:yes stop_codon:yes gene_type:complete
MQNETTLSTIEHLFQHQNEFPTDPTKLLQAIAWLWSQRMSDAGHSQWLDLHQQMHMACAGVRGLLEYNLHSTSVHRPSGMQPPDYGWYLAWVVHTSSPSGGPAGKFMYRYKSPSGNTNCVQWSTFKDREGEEHTRIASFHINGVRIYWYQYSSVGVFFLPTDWRNPEHRQFLLEVVRPQAAVFRYALYSSLTNTTCVTTTYTNSLAVSWDAATCAPWVAQPLESRGLPRPLDLVDYEDGSTAHISIFGLPTLYRFLSATLLINRKGPVDYNHISLLLTKQLRDRLWHVGSTLLFNRVQRKQELIAADPVKKCAACAVEAVKSQLALGIEAKRQRLA